MLSILWRVRFIYFASVILLSIGCTQSTPAWHVVQGQGLPESQGDFSALLLPTSSTRLLLGSQWPEGALTGQEVEMNQRALIYRSVDKGNSWHAQPFGRGRFVWAQQVGTRTYALKLVKAATGSETSVVYRSDNAGASWQEVGQVAEGVKSLLLAGETGYAVGYRVTASGANVLFKTENGGKTWQAFAHALPRFIGAALVAGNRLAFLVASVEQPTSADRLALVDASSFATKIEKLSGFQASSFLPDAAGNLWLLTARGAQGIRLVEREAATGLYQEAGVFNQYEQLAAEAVYVAGANAYVVLSAPKAYLNTYKFFRGQLHDRHWAWQEEPLPLDYTLRPYGFYPDGQCTIYALAGRLLMRK